MSSIATVTHVSPLLTGDDILKPTAQEGNAVGEVTDGDKKKKANLPAKHFKGMVFGYWHLMRLKEDSIITEDVYSKALVDYLKPFASVTDQTTLYESFENDFKMLSKDLKKMIKDHHKPPKVKKAKAVKDKKTKTKTDSKHKDDKDDKNDLVSRIVDAALTSTEPVKPKRKYNRKKSDNTVTHADNDTKVSCIGCETGIDNDDGHRDPNTNNYFPNCCCAPNKEDLDDTGDADTGHADKGDAETGDADKGDALKGDAETGDAETGDAEKGLCAAEAETGDAEKELDEEELDEEEREVKQFSFKDGFECLYDPNDLSLYDKVSHEPITSHSLQRISLPDGSSMLLDQHNFTYTL